MNSWSSIIAGALGVAVLLAGGLSAQVQAGSEQRQAPSASQEAEYSRLANSRNRESMRFGESDILVSVGIEQGSNQFRERTPALLNSTGSIAMVDYETLHDRALAMYEEGASFRSAPIAHALVPRQPSWGVEVERKPAAEAAQFSEPESTGWGWVTPLLAFVLIAFFLLRFSSGFSLSDERETA